MSELHPSFEPNVSVRKKLSMALHRGAFAVQKTVNSALDNIGEIVTSSANKPIETEYDPLADAGALPSFEQGINPMLGSVITPPANTERLSPSQLPTRPRVVVDPSLPWPVASRQAP